MRWKTKQKKIVNNGDIKIFKVFLFIPMSINGETRWLERVKYSAMAQKICDPTSASEYIYWEPLKWID